MDPRLGSLVIATHWPYVDDELDWRRATARRRALQLLAGCQAETGEPATFGRARLRSLGLTGGEAGRVAMALGELEERGVVVRFVGRGNRPTAWSFRAPLTRWRAMPWRGSARSVAESVDRCAQSRICVAVVAFASQMPVQGTHWSEHFALSPASHTSPSGQTPVERRRKRDDRDTNAQASCLDPVENPVDSRRKSGVPALATHSSSFSSIEENFSVSHEDRQDRLQAAFEAAGAGSIFPGSKHWPELVDLVAALTDDQLDAVCRDVAGANSTATYRLGAPLLLQRAQKLARSPLVRALGASATDAL